MSAEGEIARSILAMAEQHCGEFVRTADAVAVLFPNGHGTAAAMKRVYQAIYDLREKGRLRCERGRFALALTPELDDAGDVGAREPEQHRCVAAPAVTHQFNMLATTLNTAFAALHEALSDTRKAVNLAQAAEDPTEQPTGFRLTRYASTRQTFTVRRREP